LFNGWSVEAKEFMRANPWSGHPFKSSNNINGINGDTNGDGYGNETQTLAIPAVTALQEAYVRAVINSVNDLDNIIYEISNESDATGDSWQQHMIDYVRAYEATKPKRHAVGMTVPFPGTNTDVLNSTADWVSMDGSTTAPAVATGTKVSIWDTDHLCGICGDVPWVWKSLMQGHNPTLMDGYDGSPGVSDPNYIPSDPKWRQIRLNLGYARSYALRMDLAHAVPHIELVTSTSGTPYCLANPTVQYLVYSPGSNVVLDLRSVPATKSFAVEWFNSSTGVTTVVANVSGGARRTLTPPAGGADVVFLH
jgi:hypothetical protein